MFGSAGNYDDFLHYNRDLWTCCSVLLNQTYFNWESFVVVGRDCSDCSNQCKKLYFLFKVAAWNTWAQILGQFGFLLQVKCMNCNDQYKIRSSTVLKTVK